MIRPDGVVFGGAAGLHLLLVGALRRRCPLALARDGAALAGGFLLVIAPYVLWRHAYYDDWFPNTFYVKSGAAIHFALGLEYLQAFTRTYPALFLLTVAGGALALGSRRFAGQRSRAALLVTNVGMFAGYIAWAGGDYMALYRFTVPLLPLCAILMSVVLAWLDPVVAGVLGRAKPLRPVLALAVLAGLCAILIQPSIDSARNQRNARFVNSLATMRQNTEKWIRTGHALKQALWPDAVLATTAAGAIPYFAEARTLDQSGLCDRYTAKVKSDPWLVDRPGHMKQTTRARLLEVRPDLILHHPMIERQGRIPRGVVPPAASYLPRALPIPELRDEEGNSYYLYFWLREDRVREARAAGMIDPRNP
jgi:arabinofuranosyltransferase